MTNPTDTAEPTDAELEAQIANFVPMSTPGPMSIKGDATALFRRLPEPSIQMFSPETRAAIHQKLQGVTPGNRDIFERELVLAELQKQGYRARVLSGPGESANEYQRVSFNIVRQVADAEDGIRSIEAQLAEVIGHNTATDPTTGQPAAVPIHRIQGDRRKALEGELTTLRHRIVLLEGIEGERMLREAMDKTKATIREQRQALREDAAAKKLAEETVSQERIAEKAKGYAKRLRQG